MLQSNEHTFTTPVHVADEKDLLLAEIHSLDRTLSMKQKHMTKEEQYSHLTCVNPVNIITLVSVLKFMCDKLKL